MADEQKKIKYRNEAGARIGTKFENNRYQVNSLMYPSDLMAEINNQYGNNYAIFYINVHDDSFLSGASNANNFVEGNVTPAQRGEAANLSATGLGVAGAIGGAAAGKASGLPTKAVAALGANSKPGAASVLDMVGGAAAAGAAIAVIGGVKNQYKQMKQVIALHIPTDLNVRYSASWGAESLAGSSALAGGPVGVNAVGAGASYLAGVALKAPGVGELLSKTSGVTANPKKEQLFQEVDFRTFTFSYQFFPRSEQEAKSVEDIIHAFKLHMHPEFKDPGSFLYIYPSEFDIFYYQNGVENMHLHRHTSCVLTDMSISYAPQGSFTTFANGMPTQINVALTFKELALLSKETISDGF